MNRKQRNSFYFCAIAAFGHYYRRFLLWGNIVRHRMIKEKLFRLCCFAPDNASQNCILCVTRLKGTDSVLASFRLHSLFILRKNSPNNSEIMRQKTEGNNGANVRLILCTPCSKPPPSSALIPTLLMKKLVSKAQRSLIQQFPCKWFLFLLKYNKIIDKNVCNYPYPQNARFIQ